MRVVLVGPPARRQRLREQLPIGLDVVADAANVAEARALHAAADAYLIAAASDPDEPPLIESLTLRETQVLELVADGLSNKEIASRLGVSDETWALLKERDGFPARTKQGWDIAAILDWLEQQPDAVTNGHMSGV